MVYNLFSYLYNNSVILSLRVYLHFLIAKILLIRNSKIKCLLSIYWRARTTKKFIYKSCTII